MPKVIEDAKVYRAVMETIIERGYAGATTKQIAEAAEISEVTLFRKYGNKAQLVKQAIAAMVGEIDFTSATRYSGEASVDLLRVVQTYQESAETKGFFFYIMMSEIPRYPKLADLLDTPLEMIGGIGQLLARYQAEGILEQEHPLHAVAALLGPLIAANMIRGTQTDVPLPPLDLANHVAHFLNGRIRSE